MPETAAEHWNWAQTHRFEAEIVHRPSSVSALQELVVSAAAVGHSARCLGSRHSFTNIADSDVLFDLCNLPEQITVAPDRTSVRASATMTYSRLCELLLGENLAVANLASLPHLSIAGAVSTATHGSGDLNGNLATSVSSVTFVGGNGDLHRIDRDHVDFGAAAVSVGALGPIVSVELDVEPAFEVEQVVQVVHDDLSWTALDESFDPVFASAYSVSVFTDWRDHVQLWTKRRSDRAPIDHAALHDGVPAPEPRHPVPGEVADACTEQFDLPGLWSERLPHFRAGATPSVGAEVQSEFFVDRSNSLAAVAALRSIGTDISNALMVSEIRTVRRDNLWLSPMYERDCLAFHFTWQHDVATALTAARTVAAALEPFAPRPHWGKVFDSAQFNFATLYPRLIDAMAVYEKWDPNGVFQNRWMRETFAKQS